MTNPITGMKIENETDEEFAKRILKLLDIANGEIVELAATTPNFVQILAALELMIMLADMIAILAGIEPNNLKNHATIFAFGIYAERNGWFTDDTLQEKEVTKG